jgi:hypothetical protein
MNWLRQLFARRQIYRDLSEEIQQHLAEKVEALMAQGMSRRDAEYAAKRDFGNVARIEESGHEPWMWPRAESILADIRFAVRKLRHSPGFALTAILTLAFRHRCQRRRVERAECADPATPAPASRGAALQYRERESWR